MVEVGDMDLGIVPALWLLDIVKEIPPSFLTIGNIFE